MRDCCQLRSSTKKKREIINEIIKKKMNKRKANEQTPDASIIQKSQCCATEHRKIGPDCLMFRRQIHLRRIGRMIQEFKSAARNVYFFRDFITWRDGYYGQRKVLMLSR